MARWRRRMAMTWTTLIFWKLSVSATCMHLYYTFQFVAIDTEKSHSRQRWRRHPTKFLLVLLLFAKLFRAIIAVREVFFSSLPSQISVLLSRGIFRLRVLKLNFVLTQTRNKQIEKSAIFAIYNSQKRKKNETQSTNRNQSHRVM